jgi:Arc/MetJ family transcription regulator
MGRTNIVLDDRLVAKAMKLTGARTKRQAVDIALRQLVTRASLHRALGKLRGGLAWDGHVESWRRARR